MFDSLSNRLQDVFANLGREVRLTPETVEVALREIRMALLEADVNFKVVKAFVDKVRDRAVDAEVLKSLSPGQQVVRIVRDEMLALFGDTQGGLPPASGSPRVILMLGLQGSGKTTTTGKLAKWLVKQGKHPIVVSTDVRRPAAIEQLNLVAKQAGVRVHDPAGNLDPVSRASGAMQEARTLGYDTVIVDTAGRLHIDDELMVELEAIKATVQPTDQLYVADAMTGQDAIKSAGEFNRRVGVTGVVLSKMDGDARGGAALSVVSVVGVPIAFTGSGERLDDLEAFHPDRVVSRVLGMGDVLSLIEKAESVVTQARRREARTEDPRQRLHARGLPGAAPDHQEDGAAREPARHAAGHGAGEAAVAGEDRRQADGPRRGHHPVDDAPGTPQPSAPQRESSSSHRARQRHVGRGGQSSHQAVSRHEEDDEDDGRAGGWQGRWQAAQAVRHDEGRHAGAAVAAVGRARFPERAG